jgi:hypothetical protein
VAVSFIDFIKDLARKATNTVVDTAEDIADVKPRHRKHKRHLCRTLLVRPLQTCCCSWVKCEPHEHRIATR